MRGCGPARARGRESGRGRQRLSKGGWQRREPQPRREVGPAGGSAVRAAERGCGSKKIEGVRRSKGRWKGT